MASLEQEFDKALATAYRRAVAEADYKSPQYFSMLAKQGGVLTAIGLINRPQPSDGYTKLFTKGRLDLTVEAIVVDDPRWHPLFDPEIVERARKRLVAYKYKFPAGVTASSAPAQQEKAWTQREVDACVTVYLEMLASEVATQPYSKAEHNRRVQEATGRTKGSVEFKFQNVSAVLDQLGLRWIEGYKPAKNAQTGAIKDAIERLLGEDGALAKQLEPPLDPAAKPLLPADPDSVFTDPPPKTEGPAKKAALPPGSNIKKFDRALKDARNRDLGRAGEQFVLEVEKRRLKAHGRQDLADTVTWVSEDQGDGAGFDIASFDVEGTPRLIEVKTTNGAATASFMVTANEVEVSRANPGTYWLYRVYDFAKQPRIYCEKGPLDDGWNLEPAVYRAKR